MDDNELKPVPAKTDSPESQTESQVESRSESSDDLRADSSIESREESRDEEQDLQLTTNEKAEGNEDEDKAETETMSDTETETTADTGTEAEEDEAGVEAVADAGAEAGTEIVADAETEAASAKSQDAQPITAADTTVAGAVPAKPKKTGKRLMIAAATMLIALGVGGIVYALSLSRSGVGNDLANQPSVVPDLITNFDLAFLENKEANQLYSPLSIKYALGMLEAGAAGDSRQQIEAAIGSLTPQKYPSNENMSFANALFINNKLPDDTIKSSYTKDINERFGAEILRVPFTSAVPINNWVSDKTFGLIKDLVTDEMLKPVGAPEQYFALVNALAIDMEWINKIQPYEDDYYISFPNIKYYSSVNNFREFGFDMLPFNTSAINVNSLSLAATIHKYDILNELGVDNIRQTIMDEYTDWLNKGVCVEGWPEPEVYVEEYLEKLGNGGYETVSSSTDFSLYDDDEVKVFAKDLRTYDDITLQYVGIMPKTSSLKDYIQNLTTDKLALTINQLKPIALESFKDGVITNVVAQIPVFKFEDKLDLVDKLEGMGITDVFSDKRANLSNLVDDSEGLYISNAIHQTTVDFSNDGIKASAATALVIGKGSSGCGFYYDFDVPVEKIDLTFDKPYLFLIRDKNSGAIWFVGTVYEPTIYTSPSAQNR